MKCFGSWASAIKCFGYYFSSRTRLVCLDNIFFEAGTSECSVPQGSILGPVLVLPYATDLPQSLSAVGFYLYGVDIRIFYQHEDNKIQM